MAPKAGGRPRLRSWSEGRNSSQKSPLPALAVEARRQSAPEPGARHFDGADHLGLDPSHAVVVVDPRHPRHSARTSDPGRGARPAALAGERTGASARERNPALGLPGRRARRRRPRLPALRGLVQPRRHRAHLLAPARLAPAARMEDLERRRPRGQQRRLARFVASHVDRARPGRDRDHRSARKPPRRSRHRRADSRAVAGLALPRLVDLPPLRPAHRGPHRGSDPVPSRGLPKDLGFLRDLRRTARSLAAARQLAGITRGSDRASNFAHEHGSVRAREPGRMGLRLHPGGPAHRANRGLAWGHERARAIPGSLLQLV